MRSFAASKSRASVDADVLKLPASPAQAQAPLYCFPLTRRHDATASLKTAATRDIKQAASLYCRRESEADVELTARCSALDRPAEMPSSRPTAVCERKAIGDGGAPHLLVGATAAMGEGPHLGSDRFPCAPNWRGSWAVRRRRAVPRQARCKIVVDRGGGGHSWVCD